MRLPSSTQYRTARPFSRPIFSLSMPSTNTNSLRFMVMSGSSLRRLPDQFRMQVGPTLAVEPPSQSALASCAARHSTRDGDFPSFVLFTQVLDLRLYDRVHGVSTLSTHATPHHAAAPAGAVHCAEIMRASELVHSEPAWLLVPLHHRLPVLKRRIRIGDVSSTLRSARRCKTKIFVHRPKWAKRTIARPCCAQLVHQPRNHRHIDTFGIVRDQRHNSSGDPRFLLRSQQIFRAFFIETPVAAYHRIGHEYTHLADVLTCLKQPVRHTEAL